MKFIKLHGGYFDIYFCGETIKNIPLKNDYSLNELPIKIKVSKIIQNELVTPLNSKVFVETIELKISVFPSYICKGFWYEGVCLYDNQILELDDKRYNFSNGTMIELKEELFELNQSTSFLERDKFFSIWDIFRFWKKSKVSFEAEEKENNSIISLNNSNDSLIEYKITVGLGNQTYKSFSILSDKIINDSNNKIEKNLSNELYTIGYRTWYGFS